MSEFFEPLARFPGERYHSPMYGITFDPESRLSQYRQLVDQLRRGIADGSIRGGTRLASTRELSSSLGIARGIVLEAVDQLRMEGYLDAVQGSGTFVRSGLVWDSGTPGSAAHPAGFAAGSVASPARSYDRTAESVSSPASSTSVSASVPRPLSFAPGMPDMELFPRRAWLSCYHDAVEYAELDDLGYNRPSGNWRLRCAIASHLYEIKGIRVGPERVIATAGASQAIALVAELFERPRVVLEDPQAPFIRRIFDGLGCRISFAPVDDEGIREDCIRDESADLIYVTPAHQFPVGGTLSAERRVALLEKARAMGAWIIEDDFDSEFRYEGKPVTTLQAMAGERVIYVGTFSKTVSPALRIGFLVAPPGIQARAKTVKRRWDLWNEGLQQKAMALFIERGHLARHLVRAHRAYRRKNEFLRGLVSSQLSPVWRVTGATTGMHLVIRRSSPDGSPADAAPAVSRLAARGIEAETVAGYCVENPAFRDSLIVAYGNRTPRELELLVDELAAFEQPDG